MSEFNDSEGYKLFNTYADFVIFHLTSHELFRDIYPSNITSEVILKIIKAYREANNAWEQGSGYAKSYYVTSRINDRIYEDLKLEGTEDEQYKWSNLISLIGANYGWIRCLKLKELMG